jgi:hypothetical protein
MILRRGDSHTITGQVTTDSGSQVDISGWTIWFTVKRRWQDSDGQAVLIETTGGDVNIIDGPNGRFTISIAPTDFASVPNAERTDLLYDVQIKNGTAIQTLAQGRLTLLGDVTYATS